MSDALSHPPQLTPLGTRGGERQAAGLGAARPGDLREQAGGGDHVTGDEDATTAVDGGPVAPAQAGAVKRTAAAVHHLAAAPALAPAQVWIRRLEQTLQTHAGGVDAFAGSHRHLRLHQLLTVGGE